MDLYYCRDCGQQLPTRRLRSRAVGRGRTLAQYRTVPMGCANGACKRYGLPLVMGQAVAPDAEE